VTISLSSKAGTPKMGAIVGLLVFTQYWYWYPLIGMITLSFTPTALIGLNKDLRMPSLELVSNTRPSHFAYPPLKTPPSNEKVEKVATAVLSTTAKAKARAQKAEKEKEKEKTDKAKDQMNVDHPASEESNEMDIVNFLLQICLLLHNFFFFSTNLLIEPLFLLPRIKKKNQKRATRR